MIPAVCMNPCTVQAASKYGPIELDAWDVGVPGLVIAVRVGFPFHGHPRYSITHRSTGYSIGVGIDSFDALEDAVSALMFISEQPADWTHPNPQEDPAQFVVAAKALRAHLASTPDNPTNQEQDPR